MSDGAHLGYTAEAAMKQAIGGGAEEDEATLVLNRLGLRDRIMATERTAEFDYSSCCDYIAKLILLAFEADPELTKAPVENVYAKNPDGSTNWDEIAVLGLWTRLKERLSPEDLEAISGMSGFMWGWSVNAAHACLGLPPVPNPAILTIG